MLYGTRAPSVALNPCQSNQETVNTNAPTASTPISCTWNCAPAAMEAASVPQMPANRCAGTAPTTSSSFTLSSSLSPATQIRPPIAPMMIAQ